MKSIFTLLLCSLFTQFQAQDYSLIIDNGIAIGDFNYGDTVHIFSDKAPVTGVFTNWTGSGTDYLEITDEWYTTLVVPEQSAVSTLDLQANFEQFTTAPTQTTEMIELFGEDAGIFMENVLKEVHYSIPENPKGIVFLFHGSGGSGSNMFSRYDIFTLVKDLYFAGYGSIATDANERTMGDQNGDNIVRWIANQGAQQTIDNNIDLYNIAALRDSFLTRYNLPEDFPFFSFGVSNGANFSDIAAAEIGFRASAHNTGNGSPSLYNQHPNVTPVIWLQSENDQNDNANPTIALANHQTLLDRGICSEWYWLKRSPLYEKRFVRSRNNINAQKSADIYNRFFDYPDLVDTDGFILVDDIIASLPNNFYNPLNLTNAQKVDAQSQMKVANADHAGHGNYNKTIIRFFENNCVTTNIEAVPITEVVVSCYPNPTSGIFHVGMSLEQEAIVRLLNVNGQVIIEKNAVNTETKLNLSDLPSGCYFINIQIDNQLLTEKVILQND